MNWIKISVIAFLCSIPVARATECPTTFPKSWVEFLGHERMGMLFTGKATMSRRAEPFLYVLNLAEDTSLLETLKNPSSPERYQGFQLTQEGLRYSLRFNKERSFEGVLEGFEKQEDQNEIRWIFWGAYKNKEVTHQFTIKKETGDINISTYFDSRKHAEANLSAQSKVVFYTTFVWNTLTGYFN